jgi:hypothetical protein
MVKLRDGVSSNLGEFEPNLGEMFFRYSEFGITSVNTKTFILMLATQSPLSFISGAPIDLHAKLKDANRTEFHHLMPRSFIKKSGQEEYLINTLSNFSFLSRADNREIGGDPPSVYKGKIKGNLEEILRRSLIPSSLFDDDLTKFLTDRGKLLTELACKLCEIDKPDIEMPEITPFSDIREEAIAGEQGSSEERGVVAQGHIGSAAHSAGSSGTAN